MRLDELLHVMQNRLVTLNEARKGAFASGDVQRVNEIDGDLLTTQNTIEQLKITIQAMSSSSV